jgi:hypothetical protein
VQHAEERNAYKVMGKPEKEATWKTKAQMGRRDQNGS